MSFPGGMMRKNGPVKIVDMSPKEITSNYFEKRFPIGDIWAGSITDFDLFHKEQTTKLGKHLKAKGILGADRTPSGIASKLINTYMHQLMKYEEPRYLWEQLHLPLDQVVFTCLKSRKLAKTGHVKSLKPIKEILRKSPYKLLYKEYIAVQNALSVWIDELNGRKDNTLKLRSRIELNWLWSDLANAN